MSTQTATIVSYTKHWDNNTKGTMEFPGTDIFYAVDQVSAVLVSNAVEDGAISHAVDPYSDDAARLFTLTKVVLGDPTNWVGV